MIRSRSQIASTLAALPEKEILAQRNEWQKSALASIPEPSREGLTAYYPFDGDLTDASGGHHDGKVVRGEVVYDDGSVAKAADFSGETQMNFGNAGDFERSAPFALAVWVSPSPSHEVKVLQKREAGENWQGWEIAADKPTFSGRHNGLSISNVRLANRWPDDAIEVQTKERVAVTAPHHLLIDYDGSGQASGLKLYLDGNPVESEILKDQLRGDFRTSAPLEIGDKNLGTPLEGSLDDFRIYNRQLSDSEVKGIAIRPPSANTADGAGRAACEGDCRTPSGDAPGGCPDRGGGKSRNQGRREKALETDRQSRLTEYFLKYRAPEKERQLYAQLKDLRDGKGQAGRSHPHGHDHGRDEKPARDICARSRPVR